jgi:peptide/nickel transport system substrate-binding protein
VKWHDGVEFTAKDVIFSYDAMQDPELAGVMTSHAFGKIESWEALDDYTVRFVLKDYDYSAIDWFAEHHGAIYPAHVFEDIPIKDIKSSTYNSESPPPGTGPYKLIEWKPGEYAKYELFEDYYGGVKPNQAKYVILKKIVEPVTALAALEAGEVDALDGRQYFLDLMSEVDRLETEPDIEVTKPTAPAPVTMTMQINCIHPIIQNKYVRLAMAHAIPYDKIMELVKGYAEPANYYGAKGAEGWATLEEVPPFEYDLDKAREYLKMAGYPEYPAYIYDSPPTLADIPSSEWITYPIVGAVAGIILGALGVYLLMRRK